MPPRSLVSFAALALVACAVLGCDRGARKPAPAASATPAPTQPATAIASVRPPATATASSSARAGDAGAPAASASARAAVPAGPAADGEGCGVLVAPTQLAYTGPVVLAPGERPDGPPHAIFDDGGTARIAEPARPLTRRDPADKSPPARAELGHPAQHATKLPCALAGDTVYCADDDGAIHRARIGAAPDAVVERARPGTRIAAAAVGEHRVVAFLRDQITTEGIITVAAAALDGAPGVRISEEGSGATDVTLAPQGDGLLAVYVDARTAMTPVHARPLAIHASGAALVLGADAVLFIGDGSDRRSAATLGVGDGRSFVLSALPADVTSFGLAVARVDAPPRDDVPVAWSYYPAAIAGSVAATTGPGPVRVARIRPSTSDPKPKLAVELGRLDDNGAFRPSCTLAEGKGLSDVAIFASGPSAAWIAYTDAHGTWLEERGGPAGSSAK